jgi:type VI secretion system protein VasJ
VQAGKWSEALPQIETSVGNALFWLDAHRLAASALEGLGAEYADARRAVVDALAAVLRRLPILPDLVFQNGVPFADPLTRAWIAAEVLADGAGGAAATPWDQTANEARKLAGQGKIAAAADLFAQGRRQADGERARLQWELAQARFCAEIGNLTVAIPILEHLDDQIDAHRLESWEPDIAIDVSKQLLACYRKPSVTPVPGQPAPPRPPDDARAAREAKLRARLARLDVAEALRVMTG